MGNFQSWRFKRDLQNLADESIQRLFYMNKLNKFRRNFEITCRIELDACVNRFQAQIGISQAKSNGIYILKIFHQFILDFHKHRVINTERYQLLSWEWDETLAKYVTQGKRSFFELNSSPNIRHTKNYCSNKFNVKIEDIHIIYQDRELNDKEQLSHFFCKCKSVVSFVHLIYLFPGHDLNTIKLDVLEMEHKTPQEFIEKSTNWTKNLFRLLNKKIYGNQIADLTWKLIQTFPQQSGITHVLMNSDIIGVENLPVEIARLIASFVPSSVQEIYLNID